MNGLVTETKTNLTNFTDPQQHKATSQIRRRGLPADHLRGAALYPGHDPIHHQTTTSAPRCGHRSRRHGDPQHQRNHLIQEEEHRESR